MVTLVYALCGDKASGILVNQQVTTRSVTFIRIERGSEALLNAWCIR